MIIRVLIINRQLVFAVTIKQALEQTGAFEVHPFTDPNAAAEYLRTHPHDVALVDFDITVMPGPQIIKRLREIQPDIAVIASPAQSADVVRDLNLQDTVDAPFSARGIIPVIEHAAQQVSQPSSAITRSFVETSESASVDTEILHDEYQNPDQQPADNLQTNILPDEDDPVVEERAQTRIFDDDEPDEVDNRVHTQMLDDDEPADLDNRVHTKIFDYDDDDVPFENHPQTRLLDDDEPDEVDWVHTKILDDGEDDDVADFPELPSTLPESEPNEIFDDLVRQNPVTHDLSATNLLFDEDEEDYQPLSLPEFSSLDNVLNDEAPSALFEPPTSDGDTPAVPDVDSDAVRQFLATSTDEHEQVFDSMLSGLPDDVQPPGLPSGPSPTSTSEFDELVKSMRGETQHTPLPDRHQQFVEFILTGGMDGLLSEIEKSTDELVDPTGQPPEASAFERLAEEEPPMPTLEESGTVGDLMVGVSDTSFRNVLAMMRGQEVIEEELDEVPSQQEIDDAYAGFFDQTPGRPAVVEHQPPPPPPDVPEMGEEMVFPPPPEDEFDSAIPARLILDTALDESSSLNELIGDIERQLTEHKPDVMPLPSWQIQSFQPTPRRKKRPEPSANDRYIDEPDFLPEELPPLEEQPVSELFDRIDDFSEDELDTLNQDLFEEYNQIRAMQRAAQDAASRVPEEPEFDPSEAFVDELPSIHEQEDEGELIFDNQETVVNPALADEPEFDLAEAFAAEMPSIHEPEDEGELIFDNQETVVNPALVDEPEFDLSEAFAAEMPSVHEHEADEFDEPDFDLAEALADESPAFHDEGMMEDDEDEWAFDDQETVMGAALSAMADEVATNEPVTLPDNLWDDVSGAWDAAPEWDEEAAKSEPLPQASHDLDDDWELTIDESPDDETVVMERSYAEAEPIDFEPDIDFEPEHGAFDVAQIALSLTQVSLELAAEATLLTNEDEIVAFAGQLDPADIEEIRDTIADDWDANTDEARVRFITLPTTGKDYMLYSRKTVGDFTLSMIFAGTTPLRDIRRQGKRLLDALESAPLAEDTVVMPVPVVPVPQVEAPAAINQAPVDVEDDTLQSFTYLWLLRDPDRTLGENLAGIIRNGLNMQLQELGWQVQTLRAEDEYIYVRADVPGERPVYETIDDLKRRAADIVYAQESETPNGNDLWADSYLVMMPGRELEPDEIEQFINFERML